MADVDSSCGGTAWNAVEAAPTFSALAGLIGGFVFAGLVVLLVERQQQSTAARIPALIQFFAAFVALGLNSYLFGLISGEGAQACRRIWAATAISSGMLAVGTVAAVGGVVLLIHAHLVGQRRATGPDAGEPGLATNLDLLTRLLQGAYPLVAWMATLLLLARAGEALWVWLGKDLMSVVPVLIAGALVTLFAVIARFFWKPLASQPREHTESYVRQLYLAATLTVLYSVVGTVVLGALLSVVNGNWDSADSWMAWLFVVPGLVVPAAAIVLSAMGVKGLIRLRQGAETTSAPVGSSSGHSG